MDNTLGFAVLRLNGGSVTGNTAGGNGGGIFNAGASDMVTLNPGSEVCGNSNPECVNVNDPNNICQDTCA
jgi:hypothetical protein